MVREQFHRRRVVQQQLRVDEALPACARWPGAPVAAGRGGQADALGGRRGARWVLRSSGWARCRCRCGRRLRLDVFICAQPPLPDLALGGLQPLQHLHAARQLLHPQRHWRRAAVPHHRVLGGWRGAHCRGRKRVLLLLLLLADAGQARVDGVQKLGEPSLHRLHGRPLPPGVGVIKGRVQGGGPRSTGALQVGRNSGRQLALQRVLLSTSSSRAPGRQLPPSHASADLRGQRPPWRTSAPPGSPLLRSARRVGVQL
mmetsp:Transcript_45647/g.116815  ORF Transcript_45647/g.116815 Transcript_45647/m.116815 type:complete len:257 (-) Transcript_45647:55-825(-)